MKLFCDHPKLTWKHVNKILSRHLTGIIKGPEYGVTRKYSKHVRADMDFRYCLSPSCFVDRVVTNCMGLMIKGPWFTFAYTEIGGGASFALLNKGITIWCPLTHPEVQAFLNAVSIPLKVLWS